MKEIYIGREGLVLEGEHPNWYIKIFDDREETGGYLICFYKNLTGKNSVDEGYDNWVESYDQVVNFFSDDEDVEWKVEWL